MRYVFLPIQNHSIQQSLNANQLIAIDSIKNKIKKGLYKRQLYSCPICEKGSFDLISKFDRYGLETNVVLCKKCGLLQTNPRFDSISSNELYNSEYYKLLKGSERILKTHEDFQYNRGQRILNQLNKRIKLPEKSSILEIGCGIGEILHCFSDVGHITFGIDINSKNIEYGKMNNHNLTVGSIDMIQIEEKFDLILYSHTLEHLNNPSMDLNCIKKLMHKDSKLVIIVPGLKNVLKKSSNSYLEEYHNYIDFTHNFHFIKESLVNLLAKNGYQKIYCDEHVFGVFSISTKSIPIKSCYKEVRNILVEIKIVI